MYCYRWAHSSCGNKCCALLMELLWTEYCNITSLNHFNNICMMDFHEIWCEYHDIGRFSTFILPNFIPSKCHGTYKVKATVAPFNVWPWNVKQCCNFENYVIVVNMIIYLPWKMLNFYVQLSVLNTEVTYMRSDIEV